MKPLPAPCKTITTSPLTARNGGDHLELFGADTLEKRGSISSGTDAGKYGTFGLPAA
jgi:hypothetical protein